ncbi:hypothetical protein L1987_62725 [Smallanthus sonchifolius]|uniref:Uncharacterized protein n=1 Tax=Smallanthus sonchifolius TaxID=185202 RepID=A0ACB9CB60_9ASTR|nr:hypothetical protein L1987_62725 [Smallanthus sonchifolius]
MRIFHVEEENKAQTSRVIRDCKISSRRTRSSKGDGRKGQNWDRIQLSHEKNRDNDKTEGEEFRTAVAAAAFAINFIENKELEIKDNPNSTSKKSFSAGIETMRIRDLGENSDGEDQRTVRFMKVKARIFKWENKKKQKAKNKLGKLEWKRARALQDFKRKMEAVEKISKGARSKNEENRKREEIKVKEKASMRSKGKIRKPVFLCC